MSIYIKKDSSYKKSDIMSIEELKEKFNIEYVINESEFNKHIRRLKNLYCFISPYKGEIDNVNVLDWALSEKEANDNFYSSKEEI